jgi:hypothetical protein
MTEVLGIRNRNPGNIRHNPANKWEGRLPNEPKHKGFCAFSTFAYGIRALALNFNTYQRKHGLKTIRGMIERHAPPSENDTEAYISFVCDYLDKKPDEEVILMDDRELLKKFLQAVAIMECGPKGFDEIPPKGFDEGVVMARMACGYGDGKIAIDSPPKE